MNAPSAAILLFALALRVSVAWEDGLSLELALPGGEGDRFERVEFACWIPEGPDPVRAVIVHQHGCTNASPVAHPPVTDDSHWRALARKHHCALLVPQYWVAGSCDEWNDPLSGSKRALFTALGEFAKQTKRPELNSIPWVLWGHSGGSSWSAQMIVRHPGRVLAASFRGGCSKQFGVPEFREQFGEVARELPLLFVWGKRESLPTSKHYVSWEPMNTMFHELRSRGGRVTRLVDPRSEHGCDDSRLVVIPFFDAVLSAHRLGEPLPGALRDLENGKARDLTAEALRDPRLTWLPDSEMALRWREFSDNGSLRPVAPVLAAPRLKVTRNEEGHTLLQWQITPELDGGLRAIRIYRDEEIWKEFGIAPDAFLATSRDSSPKELRISSITDESPGTHEYAITFLDAAGNESPRGLPVTSLALVGILRAELSVSTDFEGGSATVEAIDQEARILRFMPGGDPQRGWPCWWYLQLDGLAAGEIATLELRGSDRPARNNGQDTDKPLSPAWAMPARAAFSTDGNIWRQTEPGKRETEKIAYEITGTGMPIRIAWGPPFTPRDTDVLLEEAEKTLPEAVTAFELTRSREGRTIRGIIVDGAPEVEGKPGVWIQARQHAWESGASWVARGFTEWIVSDDSEARWLRGHAEVTILPIMDVDNVATGNGGKEAAPRDHNRDWAEEPVYPEVAASQKHLLKLADENRLAVFLDLHNPGANNLRPFYFVGPVESLSEIGIKNRAAFLAASIQHINGPLVLDPQPRVTGQSYHPLWKQMSGQWVTAHGNPHTMAACLETAWNTRHSTTEGYRLVGRQLGLAVAEYLRKTGSKSPL